MDLSSLPKPGHDFSSKVGSSSFAYKLKNIIRYGEYKNLQDNYDKIVDVVDDYEEYIKRGGISYSTYWKMWSKIKKGCSDITKDDEREIKKILQYLKK